MADTRRADAAPQRTITLRWEAVALTLALTMQVAGAAAFIAAVCGVGWLDAWPALGGYVAGALAHVGVKIAT